MILNKPAVGWILVSDKIRNHLRSRRIQETDLPQPKPRAYRTHAVVEIPNPIQGRLKTCFSRFQTTFILGSGVGGV